MLELITIMLLNQPKLKAKVVEAGFRDAADGYQVLVEATYRNLKKAYGTTLSGIQRMLLILEQMNQPQLEEIMPSIAAFRRFMRCNPGEWVGRLSILPVEWTDYPQWIDSIGVPMFVYDVESIEDRTIVGDPHGLNGHSLQAHLALGMLQQFLFGDEPESYCPHVECSHWRRGMCRNYLEFPAEFTSCELPNIFENLFEITLSRIMHH
jgi:hypothetical protein